MEDKSYPKANDTTSRTAIRRVFSKFYGAGAWAANSMGVKQPTVSAWLRGKKTSAKLDRAMPALAAELLETKGRCLDTVRKKVTRDRRKGGK